MGPSNREPKPALYYRYRVNSDAQKQYFSSLSKITKEQIDTAIELKTNGLSIQIIARSLKVNPSTLYRVVHQELIRREMEEQTNASNQ